MAECHQGSVLAVRREGSQHARSAMAARNSGMRVTIARSSGGTRCRMLAGSFAKVQAVRPGRGHGDNPTAVSLLGSFVAQGAQRIDPRRADGRDVAGQQRGPRERGHRSGDGDRVVCPDSVQQARYQLR